MTSRDALQQRALDSLKSRGGSATTVEGARHIGANHANELKAARDLFYTWQYDMRWACTKLREQHVVKAAELSKRGEWKLN